MVYHSNDGVIKTPNYDSSPGDYPHNTECIWDINVEDGYHVVLTFVPPFDLEAHGDCVFDYVEVSKFDAPTEFLKAPKINSIWMVLSYLSDETIRGFDSDKKSCLYPLT